MPLGIDFDEEELDRFYSENAVGGPVFETAITGNPAAFQQISINRPDPVHTYEISFEAMSDFERMRLLEFFWTKYGAGIGFRFFPPQDHRFRNDLIATGDGAATVYKLYRVYQNSFRVLRRRIVKPVKDTVLVTVAGEYAALSNGAGGWYYPLYGEIDFGNSIPSYIVAINWNTGVITFDVPPPNGAEIRVLDGEYNVPVRFAEDGFASTEMTTYSDWTGVKLLELLPVALGIE